MPPGSHHGFSTSLNPPVEFRRIPHTSILPWYVQKCPPDCVGNGCAALRGPAMVMALLWLAWLTLPKVDLLPPGQSWSRRVLDREGRLLTVTPADGGRYRIWTPLAGLPPDLIAATLAMWQERAPPAGSGWASRRPLFGQGHAASTPPPDESYTAGFPHVSWKTGTSHGWHDAWAAAIAGDFVLVVWAGDFRGRPNPALTGRRTAGPLLFSLLGALDLPCPPPVPPPDLRGASFCAVSSDLPGPHCSQQVPGWYWPGVPPFKG